jgi:hypothetical protein
MEGAGEAEYRGLAVSDRYDEEQEGKRCELNVVEAVNWCTLR